MKSRPKAGAVVLALALLAALPAGSPSVNAQISGDPIDLAIVLDVSGTMRGLIDAARLNIWQIVNDLAEAEPTPRLRVALVTYGNPRGNRDNGWVRVETDLTDNLDLVSERLFQLKSRGADERVGRVLETALEKLSWSDSEHALRFLFVAGNESADQDRDVDFRWVSEAAADAGIFVTAVFCGTAEQHDAETWRELAELADGQFATIDHLAPATLVSTPFDRELAKYGELLDGTFVPVGADGAEAKRSRARQDKNARQLGPAAAATRAQTKGGPLYSSRADLVSLFETGELDRRPVDRADLPKSLRKMSDDERREFLEEMLALRREIRARIAELSGARRQFLAERHPELTADDSRSFDAVVRRTIRERAEAFGYSLAGS